MTIKDLVEKYKSTRAYLLELEEFEKDLEELYLAAYNDGWRDCNLDLIGIGVPGND